MNQSLEAGSLRGLQVHLDRKKFALARDRSTGVNFLQKAIVMDHADIVRLGSCKLPWATTKVYM